MLCVRVYESDLLLGFWGWGLLVILGCKSSDFDDLVIFALQGVDGEVRFFSVHEVKEEHGCPNYWPMGLHS